MPWCLHYAGPAVLHVIAQTMSYIKGNSKAASYYSPPPSNLMPTGHTILLDDEIENLQILVKR